VKRPESEPHNVLCGGGVCPASTGRSPVTAQRIRA
jgi:hypothetical protein